MLESFIDPFGTFFTLAPVGAEPSLKAFTFAGAPIHDATFHTVIERTFDPKRNEKGRRNGGRRHELQ